MISHVEQRSSLRESQGWFFFFVQGSCHLGTENVLALLAWCAVRSQNRSQRASLANEFQGTRRSSSPLAGSFSRVRFQDRASKWQETSERRCSFSPRRIKSDELLACSSLQIVADEAQLEEMRNAYSADVDQAVVVDRLSSGKHGCVPGDTAAVRSLMSRATDPLNRWLSSRMGELLR